MMLFTLHYVGLTECSLRHAGPQLHGQGRLHQDKIKMFVAYGMFVCIINLFFNSVGARVPMGMKFIIQVLFKTQTMLV